MQRADKRVEQFYKSRAWKDARAAYIISMNGLCERCKAKGIEKPGNYVHHKDYITVLNVDDPNITLNPDNFELLCFDCHQQEHFPVDISYEFDEEGNLIPPVGTAL